MMSEDNRILFGSIPMTISLMVMALAIIANSSCRQNVSQVDDQVVIPKNAFEKYIEEKDPIYDFEHVNVKNEEGYDLHVLKLVSQQWLDTGKVQDPIWWHWLSIVVPETTISDTAFLWIGGGDREDQAPEAPDRLVHAVAMETQTVSAYLHNIPNQPTVFKGDDYGPRYEDELISYGWRKYLEGGADPDDAEWLARFPMTKSVVRAMDAIGTYLKEKEGRNVQHFTIAGASKRGWTTWTTAVVDDRVVAIVPVVIDMLNVVPSFEHHWQVYGFWAPAVNDYVREGIMDWQHTAEYDALVGLVEPFSYLERLTMPKLLINATGDQFFLPDSWQFYWDSLPDDKYLRYVPNADHSLRESDAVQTLIAFHQMVVQQEEIKRLDWKVTDLHFQIGFPNGQPDSLKLWSTYNPEKRDFRLETIGKSWTFKKIPRQDTQEITIPLQTPENGWVAYLVEASFTGKQGQTMKLTSGVKVLPGLLPYPPYKPKKNKPN